MAFKRDRVKPTNYPRIPFHLIRSAQLLSSTIVSCIMFYFMGELGRDHYSLPWTFILLMTVSLLTMLALTTTIVLHCFYGLNPKLNTIVNSSLALLWSVAFGLLAWWSSGTLAHVCSKDSWDNDVGLHVCRLYKALFSFSLLGLVATLFALVLDVHVQRQASARGHFVQLGMLGGDGKSAGAGEHDGFGEPEANPNPAVAHTSTMSRRPAEGYALPDEQFAYGNDTTYHGAAGQVGRRSVEERI